MWRAPGEYEFSQLDDTVRAYLSADPEAYLILILRLVPPDWWMDAHEDELVRYAMGDDFDTGDEAGRVRRASFASGLGSETRWTSGGGHCAPGCSALGQARDLATTPAMAFTEWHYFGSWTEQMPDTGPAMAAHFRRWLRDRYATVDDLRGAWADPASAFETALVPGVQPRLAAGPLGLRNPADGRWVEDYYRCQQEVTVDDIELFCSAAKEATGGRVLCGAFYGYFYGVHPQTQGGHLELERLLRPQVWTFAAPY
jgi:hypothetical protein